MEQPAGHGGGDHRVVIEHLSPAGNAQIGCQRDAAFQVPLADHLEQGGSCLGGQRKIADLVNDQDPVAVQDRIVVARRPSRAARWQRAARSAAVV